MQEMSSVLHTKGNCGHRPRCVKCGKSHGTQQCTLPKTQPATYLHCGVSHLASYRGCKLHQAIIHTISSLLWTSASIHFRNIMRQETESPAAPQKTKRPEMTYGEVTRNSIEIQKITANYTQGGMLTKLMLKSPSHVLKQSCPNKMNMWANSWISSPRYSVNWQNNSRIQHSSMECKWADQMHLSISQHLENRHPLGVRKQFMEQNYVKIPIYTTHAQKGGMWSCGLAFCWQMCTNKIQEIPCIPTKSYARMSLPWSLGNVYMAKPCINMQ